MSVRDFLLSIQVGVVSVGQIAEFRAKTRIYPLCFYRKTCPAGIKKAFPPACSSVPLNFIPGQRPDEVTK